MPGQDPHATGSTTVVDLDSQGSSQLARTQEENATPCGPWNEEMDSAELAAIDAEIAAPQLGG